MEGRSITKGINLEALGWLFLAAQVALAAGAELPAKEKEPDPRELLKAVARARSQIVSGEMEFEVANYNSIVPLDGTNHVRLKVVFDGEKCRCESFDREYVCVLVGPEASNLTAAKRQELGLGIEAAVQAGLLTQFQCNHVAAYDGAVLMDYEAIKDQPFQTRIDDPRNGGGTYLFDPRILGLMPSPSVTDTIDSCLVQSHADSILLLGKELVEGVAAWHVRAEFPKSGANKRDFWIDANNPSHVCKQGYNGDAVFSIFDAANPDDPIPKEVRAVVFRGRERRLAETRYFCRSARFNIPVASASWTLAGLNMPLGTEVVDYRSSRGLGYWNGTGLSDDPPPRPKTAQTDKSESSTDAAKLMELVNAEPESLFAGQVYFTLASRLKGGVTEALDSRRSAEAERLLQRAIAAADRAGASGLKLANAAHEELSQLQRWSLGKVAPEIEGEDMDGRKMRLSDFRGNVVVVHFWATWCPPCMAMIPEERKLVERLAGKPFSLVGVNADSVADQAKVRAIIRQNGVGWRSFRDGGRTGPIASAWGVHNWPTIYVLDRKGLVRYRNVRGQALAEAVDAILREGN
ncbi:MAG: TlpA family protein disulfide reductase [Limisphaerales bacterium]